MISIRVRSRVPQEELDLKVGKVLGDDSYNVLLTGPTKVFLPNGRPLCVYLPGAMSDIVTPEQYAVLHSLRAETTNNRGLASGTLGTQVGEQKRTYFGHVSSNILGAFDPGGTFKFCRLTAWTGRHLPEWELLRPAFQRVAERLHQYVPERYGAQMAEISRTHEDWVIPGTPFTTVTVNNCVDPETECLTRKGWSGYGQISAGDEILAYDPQTNTTRWEELSGVFVNDRYDGPMTELSSRGFSAFTTPDHRWPVQPPLNREQQARVVHTRDLPASNYWSVMRAAPYEAPDESAYSDAFVRLAAWYFTEGTLLRSGTSVSLCQSDRVNPTHVDSIRRDVKTLGAITLEEWRNRPDRDRSPRDKTMAEYRAGRTGRSRRTGLVVNEYRDKDRPEMVRWVLTGSNVQQLLEAVPGKDKVPSPDFLSSLTLEQLRLFVDTAVAADGSPEHGRFYQYHSGRMDAFLMAATLAGIACTVDTAGTCCSLRTERSRISTRTIQREEKPYQGIIWCPQVPSGHWVARRRGSVYVTGNTYPTGMHTDKGDLDAGFSTIFCLRRGSYTGGTFLFPEYRVGVDLKDGDLILMDAHQWHANTAIVCACGERRTKFCQVCGAERISVVSYFRTAMTRCGSETEEIQRAIAYRERTKGVTR